MSRTRCAHELHASPPAAAAAAAAAAGCGGARRLAVLLLFGAVFASLAGTSRAIQVPSGNTTSMVAAEADADVEESGETMVDGSADIGATTLKPTERFRRLIPYMTFYFAQQGLAQRPYFQQYVGPAPTAVLPPRYQGNLAVPAGYLLRGKAPATARPPQPFRTAPVVAVTSTTALPPLQRQPPPPAPAQRGPAPHPRPFTLAYDPLLYAPPSPPDSPAPPPPPRPVAPGPPPLTPEQRTAALFRLLVLLQQRRTPQPHQPVPAAVPVSAGSVAALAQTLALLQAAQSLPGEAPGAVAKLLAQQLLVAPPPAPQAQAQAPARPAPPARLPVAALYGVRVPATYRPPAKAALLPLQQVTTLTPDVSPDLLYNTVSPSPAPAATPTPPPPLPAARPTPLVPVDDVDLQNYLTPVRIAHVEVRPNGHDVHSPLKLVPTSSTTAAPPPPPPPAPPAPPQPPTPPPPPAAPAPALRPYGYASKAPPVLGRVTFTQSYPDPDAEGGTPGRPGVDYPTLASIPPTTFDCKSQRYKGFFGDPETHCQVWHYCDLNGGQASFLCPNGTIFSQVALTCDWWFNVRCASTPQLYVLNERLYKYILPVMPSFPEDFTGPLVDQYLTLKFREQEQKSKAKAKGAKAPSSTPKPTTAKPQLPPAQPTQNTLQDLEDDR